MDNENKINENLEDNKDVQYPTIIALIKLPKAHNNIYAP